MFSKIIPSHIIINEINIYVIGLVPENISSNIPGVFEDPDSILYESKFIYIKICF